MDYQPNIGAVGRRVRNFIGLVALVFAVVVALVFAFRPWSAWRLVVFFPLAAAAASWLEARRRTCVLRAAHGTVEGDDGSTSPAPACDVVSSRKVARGIVRDAVLVGAVGAALVAVL